jgi:hypothetical protein
VSVARLQIVKCGRQEAQKVLVVLGQVGQEGRGIEPLRVRKQLRNLGATDACRSRVEDETMKLMPSARMLLKNETVDEGDAGELHPLTDGGVECLSAVLAQPD